MIHAVPSADEQLAFLRQLQRLLDEGSFVASYKYALLHAIADLCVLKGDDSGAPLTLETGELADQFVRLYWAYDQVAWAGGQVWVKGREMEPLTGEWEVVLGTD